MDGLCLSACAHFVFLPALFKTVKPNSIVAFHHTATSMSQAFVASGRRDLASFYLPVAQQEQDLYRSAGLSRRILEEPFQMISPICYRESEDRPLGSEYRAGVFTQFTFYIPALSDLYRNGVTEIGGFWPTTPQDVEPALARFAKNANVSFKMKQRSAGFDAPLQPARLPACPDGPIPSLPSAG